MFPIQSNTEDSSKLYVDDVFSTYLYTGNGSTQTINNGIDLAGKGGLVWIKGRTSPQRHCVYDTLRGGTKELQTSATGGESTQPGVTFASDGHNIITGDNAVTGSGINYVSWTFRKAPKFFDVMTYTGNGVAGRQIPHSLGVAPGMMIVKSTSQSGSYWFVWHRNGGGDGVTQTNFAYLNSTDAVRVSSAFMPSAPTSTYFTIMNTEGFAPTYTIPGPNTNGATYVAYLFAHDPSADGIIQCGFVNNGTKVTLGWEPQFLLYKSDLSTTGWVINDSMRGMGSSLNQGSHLEPNTSSGEGGGFSWAVDATGFTPNGGSFIYLAIRRPNKPPTTGTEVFASTTGQNLSGYTFTSNFPVDLGITKDRGAGNFNFAARLTGSRSLDSSNYAAETTNSSNVFDSSTRWYNNLASPATPVSWMFKRAPGFFDVVAYTGNGASGRVLSHNLQATPELAIIKSRAGTTAGYENYWDVIAYGLPTSGGYYQEGYLHSTDAFSSGKWAGYNIAPTASSLTLSANDPGFGNKTGATYIAYLFSSLAGVSKVGSYTGNGSSQTINCGFSAGARFVLIKRTDSTGDWYVWDFARGILAANDPHLSLNTTAAEVTTDDSVDPDSLGFLINQNTATNINVNGGSYIFLAIA